MDDGREGERRRRSTSDDEVVRGGGSTHQAEDTESDDSSDFIMTVTHTDDDDDEDDEEYDVVMDVEGEDDSEEDDGVSLADLVADGPSWNLLAALLGRSGDAGLREDSEFMTEEEMQEEEMEQEQRAQSSGATMHHDNDDDDDDSDDDGKGNGSPFLERAVDGSGSSDEPPRSDYLASHPNARLCRPLKAQRLRRRAAAARHGVSRSQHAVHPRIKGTHLHHVLGLSTGMTSVRLGNLHNTALIHHEFQRGRLGLKGLQAPHRVYLMREQLPNFCKYKQAQFREHVFCGAYSSNGSMFMSACQDDVLRLYDTSRDVWSLRRSVYARDVGWAVVDTCYSPNQMYLIYSSWSNAIRLITLEGDRHEDLVYNRNNGHTCPFSIRFSQDSSEIVAGVSGGTVVVYDINRDMLHHDFTAHREDVNAVAFADESTNVFISGSDDAICKVWDRRTIDGSRASPVGAFRGHTHGITFIDSKNDGRYFISQGKESSIKLWDMRAMQTEQEAQPPLIRMMDYRWGVRRQPASQRRRLRGDASVMTYTGHLVSRTLMRARFSPSFSTGQRYVYAGCTTGRVFIWDVLTGAVVSSREVHNGIVRDVSWHPFKPILATSSWDGTVKTSTAYMPNTTTAAPQPSMFHTPVLNQDDDE
ncbi:WD repeat domain 23 [Salpingoeca rosetta]|uniref:WD repeat domain 23 n=1 Tax=Salpingoeca rosetta (strain ATCC 50818 / BSB-021) TaxID=946362 RepID=F2UNT7_SALR5|nr:WD repeat domain 23 [Salpingoeca rosetta]EGD79292.1 WD repeat domain 23 [Salpingoeca rosetta]|eukprot:XP_004989063.1 WD repeat domain 23 [Salpingoeca rosetta]